MQFECYAQLDFMLNSIEHKDIFLASGPDPLVQKMKFENCRHVLIESVHYS